MTELTNVYKLRVLDAACRTDFPSFVGKCFHTLAPNGEYLMNWHILAVAYHLEQVRQGKIKRLIINLPPRSLKSLMCSVAFPAFVLGHDPSKRIISVTYGSDLAVKFGNDFRAITSAIWYQTAFPAMRIAGKDTESEVATWQHGYRLASSIEGSLTGRGGEIIILDDPLKASDALSDSRRTTVNDVFSSSVYSRLDSKRSGAIVVVMQRLHVDDLAGMLRRSSDEWTVLSLPAIAADDERIQIGENEYHHRRIGEALHPEREPIAILESTERTLSADTFAAQYQQVPVPPGGAMIKCEWVRRYDRLPDLTPSCEIIQSWDTANAGNEKNDWSVGTTWMIDGNDYHYLVDVHRGRWDYPTLEDRAIANAQRHQPRRILIENTGVGPALIAKLTALGFSVIGIKPEGSKQIRMSIQSAKFKDGRVLLPNDAPWLRDFEDELFNFPSGRHDDQVDSCSQALTHKRVQSQWTKRSILGMQNFHNGLNAQLGTLPDRRTFEAMGIGAVQAYLLGLTR